MIVSIVTVCYNSEKTIERTIRSVLGQTYRDIEYVIIDGASTDGTLEVIRRYEPLFDGRLRWISEPDGGIYHAMNKGVALCAGDLIGILNSDDYYFRNTVETVVRAATTNRSVGIFHGNVVFVSQSGIPVVWKSKYVLTEKDLYFMKVNHPSLFIRKSSYARYGAYNTKYRLVADYELIVRYLAKHGLEFHYINEPLACMHAGGASTYLSEADFKDIYSIIIENNLPRATLARWYLVYALFSAKTKLKEYGPIRRSLPTYRRIRDTIRSRFRRSISDDF